MPKLDAFDAALISQRVNLMRCALNLTRHHDAAEDLVQDTMVRALQYRATFKEQSNFGGWLYTIMRNLHIEQQRRKRLPLTRDETAVEAVLAAADATIGLDMLDMHAAIMELSPDARTAVMLSAGGRPYGESAAIMGCEAGTIKSRTSRGREALKAALGCRQLRVDRFAVTADEAAEHLLEMAA